MRTYIGTKIIKATPMTDLQFNQERNMYQAAKHKVDLYQQGFSILPHGECYAESMGIPPTPKEGYKVMYPDGYISWSPKEQFEIAYREITNDERKITA